MTISSENHIETCVCQIKHLCISTVESAHSEHLHCLTSSISSSQQSVERVDLWDSVDGELRGFLPEEFVPAAARGATHQAVMGATVDPADRLCHPLQWKSRALAPGKEGR